MNSQIINGIMTATRSASPKASPGLQLLVSIKVTVKVGSPQPHEVIETMTASGSSRPEGNSVIPSSQCSL